MNDNSFRNLMIPPQNNMLKEVMLRLKLVLRLLADKRVNFFVKLIPIGALAYLISPVDLAPGVALPVIGALDDAAVLWLGTTLFMELCPPEVIREHARTLTSNLDILEHENGEEVIDADIVEVKDE
ncbi:MAG: YkvA family protein [Candidatus Villigracilaceae bacterium]